MADVAYFAVADPGDASQMTYWRRDQGGRISPWPTRARYGPVLYKRDVPKGLGAERGRWVQDWFRAQREPWQDAVLQGIADEPEACQARFAVFAIRCCRCGRGLTDPKSKSCGIGPECRSGLPEEFLGRLAVLVGRVHAESLALAGVQAQQTGEVA